MALYDEDSGTTFDDPNAFSKARADQLKARRQQAADMTKQAMQSNGQLVGRVYVGKSPLENFAQGLAGGYQNSTVNREQTDMEQQQRRQQQQFAEELAAAPDEQAKRRILGRADAAGLRTTLQQQFMTADEQRAARSAEAQLARADKAEQRDLDRQARADQATQQQNFQASQNALYKRTADQLTAVAGGRPKDPEDVELDRELKRARIESLRNPKSAGEKGLTAKQLETQRGFMDMQSSLDNYEKLLDAYDFQGKSAIDPAKRAQLEGAYTDVQMKLKTLYELGAPQAGDLKLLSQALPNPTGMSGTVRGAAFGSSPFKARLGETRKLLGNSRANFERQFNRETPPAAQPKPQQSAPQEALDFLKANPNQAAAFKAKYGYLPKGY